MSRGSGGLPLGDLDHAVRRASGPLRELDGCSLFVTGGTGFFGRWLLAVLAHAQAEMGLHFGVTVLSRRPDAFAETDPDLAALPFLRVVAGDVRSFVPPSDKFTHVIHAATDTSVAAGRDPRTLIGSITDGTSRVLDLATRSGASRLLYVSSGAVYGRHPAELPGIAEDFSGAPDPLDRGTSYGQAKRFAEHLCAVSAGTGGLEPVIARAFAFVGPGLPLDAHFAIGNFIRDALAGQDIIVEGDGTPLRSYLYAGDLAAWLLTLLAHGRSGRAYNVGSDQAISVGELARTVASLAPGQPRVTIRGRPGPDVVRNNYVPKIDRARAELGLDVWTPLDEAIRRTMAHARDRLTRS